MIQRADLRQAKNKEASNLLLELTRTSGFVFKVYSDASLTT